MEEQNQPDQSPKRCSIKKEFLSLQGQIKLAMADLEQGDLIDTQQLADKKNLLSQAQVLSKEILEAHDETADCQCFVGYVSEDDNRHYLKENPQVMQDHLNNLKKLLEKLDPTKSPNQVMKSAKSALNPLSSCFVPKHFKPERSPDVGVKTNVEPHPETESKTDLKSIWNLPAKEFNHCEPVIEKCETDKFSSIWSVNSGDGKLWKMKSGCPPPLGCLPVNSRQVLKNDTHTNSKSDAGDDCIDSDRDRELRLNDYKNQFKRFVSEICFYTQKLEHIVDVKAKQNSVSNSSFPKKDLFGLTSSGCLSKLKDNSEKQFDPFRSQHTICDPPCSVWCDSKNTQLPKPAEKPKTLFNRAPCKSPDHFNGDNSNRFEKAIAKSSSTAETAKSEKLGDFNKTIIKRERERSGDSGYASVKRVSVSTTNESKCCIDGQEFPTIYNSEYWTPLPTCVPTTQTQRQSLYSGGDRLSKLRKPRPKRLNTNLSINTGSRMSTSSQLAFRETDFPTLSSK